MNSPPPNLTIRGGLLIRRGFLFPSLVIRCTIGFATGFAIGFAIGATTIGNAVGLTIGFSTAINIRFTTGCSVHFRHEGIHTVASCYEAIHNANPCYKEKHNVDPRYEESYSSNRRARRHAGGAGRSELRRDYTGHVKFSPDVFDPSTQDCFGFKWVNSIFEQQCKSCFRNNGWLLGGQLCRRRINLLLDRLATIAARYCKERYDPRQQQEPFQHSGHPGLPCASK